MIVQETFRLKILNKMSIIIRIMILKITKILIVLIIATSGLKVSDFKPNLFQRTQEVGFKDVDTGDYKIGQIMVFADINGDHYHDYAAVPDKKGKQIYVYLWNEKLSNFSKTEFNVTKTTFGQIEQIMTADLNSDGKSQMIVTYSMADNSYELQIYHTNECIYEYQENLSCTFVYFQTNVDSFKGMTSLPFMLDPTGQGKVSIVSIVRNQRYISTLSDGKTFTKSSFNQLLTNSADQFNLITKHFAAIVDIDGNCESDLVIISEKNNHSVFEFYIKRSQLSKYERKDNNDFKFNEKIVFSTFIDLDGNAGTDLVMIVEDQNKKRKIMVSYNKNTITQLCKVQEDGYQEIPYHLDSLQQMVINKAGIQPLNALNFGDINNDGYPDLLAIFTEGGFKKVYLFLNTFNEQTQRREFSENQYTKEITTQTTSPYQATIFDYAEDGKLDLLIMINQNQQSSNGTYVTRVVRKSVINNLQEDTLFVKILPLSPTSNYQSGDYSISSAFGVTIQWVITLLDGSKKVQLLNQRSQVNYGALQLPFALGGLGRTNNYVEDLTVGYEGKDNIMDWSPIIPNSQLMVYRGTESWKLQTLLTDNQRVYHVIYISIGILIVLAVVILLLNYRENLQDKKDHYNVIQLIR